VHDKLWAEVHLGVIGKQWDILLIEACYKGRLSYNMNIVKVSLARSFLSTPNINRVFMRFRLQSLIFRGCPFIQYRIFLGHT
jgi:hypothetical protein